MGHVSYVTCSEGCSSRNGPQAADACWGLFGFRTFWRFSGKKCYLGFVHTSEIRPKRGFLGFGVPFELTGVLPAAIRLLEEA